MLSHHLILSFNRLYNTTNAEPFYSLTNSKLITDSYPITIISSTSIRTTIVGDAILIQQRTYKGMLVERDVSITEYVKALNIN